MTFFFQRQSGALLIIPVDDYENTTQYRLFEFSDIERYLMLGGRTFIHMGDGGRYEEGDVLEYYIHDDNFYYIENNTYMRGAKEAL